MNEELIELLAELFDAVNKACERHPQMAAPLLRRLIDLVREVDAQLGLNDL